MNKQLLSLARGPTLCATYYKGYITNRFRFHTQTHEAYLKTQNSRVIVKGAKHTGNVDYYGEIVEIIELDYTGKNRVVLFKCDWYEVPP